MDQFEKKPWKVNDPYCEICRGFFFIEREGHPHRFPCPCQAIQIPFNSIIVDEKFNLRADGDVGLETLVASIREEGLLNPLIVARDGDGYKMVNGFRRYKAMKRLCRDWAGFSIFFEKIPVFILKTNTEEAIAKCILRENS